jgi:hypothetical protein
MEVVKGMGKGFNALVDYFVWSKCDKLMCSQVVSVFRMNLLRYCCAAVLLCCCAAVLVFQSYYKL